MKRKIIILVVSFVTFFLFAITASSQVLNDGTFKFGRTLSLIDAFYVDSTNLDALTEKAIIEVLKNLDPHSTYISAKDVKEMNEPLNGNFEGIGVQFNVLRDSIIIIEPIVGGPSEKVGIRAGDRIISINKEKVAGIKISTTGVRSRLMGPKGTKVEVVVYRKGVKDLMDFTIIRDKIPILSLDASYMLDKETGYIKLNKFAATTEKEFSDAVDNLKKSNMKSMVLDLRQNGGGYMLAATQLADKFFTDQKLLVYLLGRKTPKQEFKSTGNGSLASSRLVVLTDEGSASASEIFAGAIQDWDRGIIMGRRTFGKGLVQNGFYLTDGSMIRLTVARYYTPTGRSIQRPYNEGYDKYMESFYKRFTDGELMSADSIRLADSLKFKTLVNKRIVYGGGGIMPDVFVSADTSYYSQYFQKLNAKNILNTFTLEYYDKNRTILNTLYKSFSDFDSKFQFSDDDIKSFIAKGEAEGVKFNEAQFNKSKNEILLIMKGFIASNMWKTSEFYQIINKSDKVLDDALKLISDKNRYDSLLGVKQ
jgi:carboxyl-terminal processing protease